MDKYTFRKWLQEKFSHVEWEKTLKRFIGFPFWELMLGIMVFVFSWIWLFATIWYIGIPLTILGVTSGVLLMLHAEFREMHTYHY